MNKDRFQEAKRIYNSALEREPEQRKAYLEGVCAGDASLRKEVESLLACQPEAKEFLGIRDSHLFSIINRRILGSGGSKIGDCPEWRLDSASIKPSCVLQRKELWLG